MGLTDMRRAGGSGMDYYAARPLTLTHSSSFSYTTSGSFCLLSHGSSLRSRPRRRSFVALSSAPRVWTHTSHVNNMHVTCTQQFSQAPSYFAQTTSASKKTQISCTPSSPRHGDVDIIHFNWLKNNSTLYSSWSWAAPFCEIPPSFNRWLQSIYWVWQWFSLFYFFLLWQLKFLATNTTVTTMCVDYGLLVI